MSKKLFLAIVLGLAAFSSVNAQEDSTTTTEEPVKTDDPAENERTDDTEIATTTTTTTTESEEIEQPPVGLPIIKKNVIRHYILHDIVSEGNTVITPGATVERDDGRDQWGNIITPTQDDIDNAYLNRIDAIEKQMDHVFNTQIPHYLESTPAPISNIRFGDKLWGFFTNAGR